MAITTRLGALVLATLTALTIAGCSGSSDRPDAKPTTAKTSAKPKAAIELTDSTLVTNPNGSATLSGTIINHSGKDQEITGYSIKRDGVALQSRAFHLGECSDLEPGRSVTIGRLHSLQIQVDGKTSVGESLAVQLKFTPFGHPTGPIVARANVPVVARTAENVAVAGAKSNPDITVEGGKIVVIPGQKKAYVGATVVGKIEDYAWELPTAVDADGHVVKYRHQTATGGPYGVTAVKGRRMVLGGPPYRIAPGQIQGDADYFDAKDIRIGEKITVTIPFQSGNVEGVFTVVAG